MKPRSFRFLTVMGLKNAWANRLMSLASIGVLFACMFLIGVAVILSHTIDRGIDDITAKDEVMVFFNDELDEPSVQAKVAQIADMDNIRSAEYISKEAALETLKEHLGADADVIGAYSQEEQNELMPAGARIKYADLSKHDATTDMLEKLEGVQYVRTYRAITDSIVQIQQIVTLACTGIIILLMGIAMMIISNTIRITMFTRKLEISIMKAVGATDAFVRFPFIVEGILLGLLAALLTVGFIGAVYAPMINVLGRHITFNAVSFGSFWLELLGIFSAIGVASGLLSSFLMISKYLRHEGSEFRVM